MFLLILKNLSTETMHQSITCYDKALEINPMNVDAYNNKYLSQYYLGYNE